MNKGNEMIKKARILQVTLADLGTISQRLQIQVTALDEYLLGIAPLPTDSPPTEDCKAGIINLWIAMAQEVYGRLKYTEDALENLIQVVGK